MMQVYLIRHGQTLWTAQHRYIGLTDQPLSAQGRAALLGRTAPPADRLYVSPLRRCRETAALLYPDMPQQVVPGLRECDFGAFEGHTYEELRDDPAYCRWLDTAGAAAPPGGEGKAACRARTVQAFLELIEKEPTGAVALVVHGGTIMTLMEALEDSGEFYRWQVGSGEGLRCQWADGRLRYMENLF